MFLDPRNYAPKILFEKMQSLGVSIQNSRRLLGSVIGKGECDPQAWAQFCILPREVIDAIGQLPRLKLERQQVSALDGFRKLLFRTHDGLSIETVIIPLKKENCVSLCLSSQIGCVMNCAFCATARMPQRRNLETWEIVDQFIQARAVAQAHGRIVTGTVFMGMGEPFLNYESVLAAAELFCYPVVNAISARSITISTVGHIQEIQRFTDEKRPFRLSISLGAATDEKRAKLVPVAARTPIAKVLEVAKRHATLRKTRVMLSYVCIANENVFEEDAKALGALIGDTPVRLDLIEVTDATGRFQRPSSDEMVVFRDALTRYVKQPVVRRYSGGADIQAACGTLAGEAV